MPAYQDQTLQVLKSQVFFVPFLNVNFSQFFSNTLKKKTHIFQQAISLFFFLNLLENGSASLTDFHL